MIPAAAFIPTYNSDYFSMGSYLAVASGSGSFTAPLSFPVPIVNIKKIAAYAYDNSGGASVCVSLYRARPIDASEPAGQVCTVNASARSTPPPRSSVPAGSTQRSTPRTFGWSSVAPTSTSTG